MNDFEHQQESTLGFTASRKNAAPESGPSMVPAPSHGDIARRAYDIYLKTGRQEGQCQRNWQEAEQAIQHEGQATCAAHECGCGTSLEPHAKFTPVMKTIGGTAPSIPTGGHPARGVRHPVHSTGHGSKA